MCNENNTPCALASAICSAKKACNALALITDESIISPANKGVDAFNTLVEPSLPTNSIFTSVAAGTVTDCSLP